VLPPLPPRSSAPPAPSTSDLRRATAREMVKHIAAAPAPATRPDNVDADAFASRHANWLLAVASCGAHLAAKHKALVAPALLLANGCQAHQALHVLEEVLQRLLDPGFLAPAKGWHAHYARCRRFIELRARIEWALDLNPDPAPHWRHDPAAFEGLHPYYLNFPPEDEGDEEDLP